MPSINPYITFNGNCEEAFSHYKSIFGGDIPYIGRYSDMPPSEDGKSCPPGDENKIMHVCLPIGEGTMLMGSDSSDAFGHATIVGNNITISVNAGSTEEADRIFNGLAEGGRANMPMSKTFWGAYFGMLTDKFGINWMVNYDENPQM